MLNISVGDLVIPRNWPDNKISLDVEPDPNDEASLGRLMPWRPGTGPGIITAVLAVNENYPARWVKVFSPTATGWCFSNELIILS
jgi:hypothetical protein